jgi:ABC-type nitrate/sulfonate/bicarbonate transport system substrate-binding protein
LNLKRISLALAVALVVPLGIAACGGSSDPPSSSGGVTTIRYEQFPDLIDPLEVASYLGYLPHLKLDAVGTVLGGPASIQDLATGQADVGMAFNGAIVNLVAAGAKIKAVIGYYGSNSQTYESLDVLGGSSITSAKDLIGKTIGVNTLGANETEVISLWLAKEGLTPAQIKQVQFVVVPPIDAYESLVEHKLDAAVLTPSILAALQQKGVVLRRLATDTQVLGDYTGGSIALRDDFIKADPAVVKELVAGIAKADKWLQVTPRAQIISTAITVAKLHGRPGDIPVIKAWKSTGIAELGGYIRPGDFQPWITAGAQAGQFKEGAVSLSDVYTNQFNPYAPSGGA